MARGLAQFIDRVRREPGNKVMVHRLLVLLAEMPDSEEKLQLIMELAKAILKTMPFDAIRLGHIVFGKAGAQPELVARGFDIAGMKMMIEGLKELGRFAKAAILEVELERLLSAKRAKTKPAQAVQQVEVKRFMQQFSDEIAQASGAREDSLGNMLTQLSRGQSKLPAQKLKLPDLDLFGKDDKPSISEHPTVRMSELSYAMPNAEAVPTYFLGGSDQLRFELGEERLSFNQEQIRVPQIQNEIATPPNSAFAEVGVQNGLTGASDLQILQTDTLPQMAIPDGLPILPEKNSEEIPQMTRDEVEFFSIQLEQQEQPVQIKRTPIFRDDVDMQTQARVLPVIRKEPEEPTQVALHLTDFKVKPPASRQIEARPQEAELTHFEEGYHSRVDAPLSQQESAVVSNTPGKTEQQNLSMESRRADPEVEMQRFFSAWLQRMLPQIRSDGRLFEQPERLLLEWMDAWNRAGGAGTQEQHRLWLLDWKRQSEKSSEFSKGLSQKLMLRMMQIYGDDWWQVAQATLGSRQLQRWCRMLVQALQSDGQWRQLLHLIPQMVARMDDLLLLRRLFSSYAQACQQLARQRPVWRPEDGIAALKVLMQRRPVPSLVGYVVIPADHQRVS